MKDYYKRIVELSLKKCLKDDYGDRRNVQKHNRAVTSFDKLVKELENVECTDVLDRLMSHDDHRVRANAAYACFKLKLLEDKAKLTLEDIINNPQDSMVSFEAEMVMRLRKVESGEINSIFEDKIPAEHLADKQYLNELNDKFVALHHKYRDSYKDLIMEVESKAYKTEYCRGGKLMHRGYYSPSLSDLFIRNKKRGKLLKNIPADGNFTYEYIFDTENKLICVKKYNHSEKYHVHLATEVIVYENDTALAFTYSEGRVHPHNLRCITECRYENDKLVSYEIAYLPPECTDSTHSIYVETFEYSDELVTSFDWFCFDKRVEYLDHKHLSLCRDENDYIVSVEEDDLTGRINLGISRENNIFTHPVKKKRK